MPTANTAITPQFQELRSLLGREETRKRFEYILKAKAPMFVASVLNTVTQDSNLQRCDPLSILAAATTAACLDLPIDKNLGFAAIVPYKAQAQFQMMYKGYIQLALRSKQYEIINAAYIYEGQKIIEDQLTGQVRLEGEKASDKIIGYVAYFKMKDGFEKYFYMSIDDVRAHAERYSKAFQYDLREGKKSSPWSTCFDKMGLKTVLKALISKYGIMSIQMLDAFEKDAENGTSTEPSGIEALNQQVLDAQFEDEPAPQIPEQNEPPGPPEDAIDWAATLIGMGLAENEHAAKAIIKGLNLNECDQDEGIKRARGYRGWRDMGDKPANAFKSILAGEYPKG